MPECSLSMQREAGDSEGEEDLQVEYQKPPKQNNTCQQCWPMHRSIPGHRPGPPPPPSETSVGCVTESASVSLPVAKARKG